MVANQVEVIHILGVNKTVSHKLSKYARVSQGDLLYDRIHHTNPKSQI